MKSSSWRLFAFAVWLALCSALSAWIFLTGFFEVIPLWLLIRLIGLNVMSLVFAGLFVMGLRTIDTLIDSSGEVEN